MSKFSNYLRKLIDQSGESIASISRNAGIERTSIHKALKDERILSYKAMQILARYFGLCTEERQEFFRLHDISLQGEDAYENRQAVCDFLNTLASVDFSMFPPPKVNSLPLTDSLINGEYAVRSIIRSVLIYEVSHHTDVEIQMFLPEKLDLTMEFMELWLNENHFSVSELLYLHRVSTLSPNPARRNLKKLGSIIPLCLASRGSYKPYYFTENQHAVTASPLIYYIITPSCLLQISEDLSTARISDNTELISYYRNFFKRNCKTAISSSSAVLILWKSFRNTLPALHRIPCRFYVTALSRTLYNTCNHQKYLNSNDMPYHPMYELVEQHFSVLRQDQITYLTVFTEKVCLILHKPAFCRICHLSMFHHWILMISVKC